MKQWSRGLLLLLVVAQSACVPNVEQPEVWVTGATLSSLGLSGGSIDVRLGVFNPNEFGFQSRGLSYDLDFQTPDGDWLDFTEGRLDRELSVAGGDTAQVVVPVEFTYRGLGELARGLVDRGSFEYRVSGSVSLEEPVRRSIPFRHTGTITPSGVR